MEASVTITDSPDEVPRTENPQAICGETSMEEDASNQGCPADMTRTQTANV